MNSNDTRVEAIFHAALELSGQAEREALLARECAGDPALEMRVRRFLEVHESAAGLLEGPLKTPATGAEFARLKPEQGGEMIGPFKLREQIGEGGFGTVWVADQERPVRRRVALKIIKVGMDTKEVIARFEQERQALALMEHANIAKVFDAGATQYGRPFFVMELVRGMKITDYCDERQLSTEARLGLFIEVCQAVQHAHQKGIIHRDLKPSNILVTINDGKAVPKVIDFGVAKATQGRLADQTVYTQFQQMIGTPLYMSPEQAGMTSLDVDTRSDIYALGVVLYELLTGRTPIDTTTMAKAGMDEIRRLIREVEPPKPSQRLKTLVGDELTSMAKRRQTEPAKLSGILRGDLDWIVMKCLEKDRARRYETANGLALDLQRHLANEVVTARPPTTAYLLGKLIRRNMLAFAAGAAIAASLVIGIAASLWQAAQAIQAKHEAMASRQQADEARNNESQLRLKAETEAARSQQVARFMKDMLKGVGPSVALGRDTALIKEILNQTAERIGRDLKSQPELSAELQNTIGEVWCALGDNQKAKAAHQEALAIRIRVFGPDHPLVAESLHNLAIVLRSTDNDNERIAAERLEREALEIRRKLLGNEHPVVAESLNELGRILQYTGLKTALAEAEVVQREALAMRRKFFGNKSAEAADSLKNLAGVLCLENKAVEAENHIREALQIQRGLYGNEHPQIADALGDLARVLDRQGRLAEAEQARRECLALRRKFLASDHFEIFVALQHLGNLLRSQGKSSEAEAVYREALAIAEKRFPDGFSLFDMQDKLRGVLCSQGKFVEARAVMIESLKTDSPNALNSAAWNFATSPEPEMRDGSNAVIFAEKAVAETNRMNALFLDTLAAAYAEVRQFDKAIATQQEAIGRLTEGDQKLDCILRLKLYEAGWPMRDHGALAEKAKSLLDAGKFAEAETVARECLAYRERLIPDSFYRFNAESMLGGSLLGQKKYTEAEPLLLSGFEGVMQRKDQIPAGRQSRPEEARQRLIQLYEQTNRPDQAAKLKSGAESSNPPVPR